MRRQVDHHLARARAVGRRAFGHSRTGVMEAVEAVERAVARLHPRVRFDTAGAPGALVAMERQDLDEILGNLIENAAKYGGGSVFVTVDPDPAARAVRGVDRGRRARHSRKRPLAAVRPRRAARHREARHRPRPRDRARRGRDLRRRRSSSARARTSAGCSCGCACRARHKPFSSGWRYCGARKEVPPCSVPRSRVGRGGRSPSR